MYGRVTENLPLSCAFRVAHYINALRSLFAFEDRDFSCLIVAGSSPLCMSVLCNGFSNWSSQQPQEWVGSAFDFTHPVGVVMIPRSELECFWFLAQKLSLEMLLCYHSCDTSHSLTPQAYHRCRSVYLVHPKDYLAHNPDQSGFLQSCPHKLEKMNHCWKHHPQQLASEVFQIHRPCVDSRHHTSPRHSPRAARRDHCRPFSTFSSVS
mmetsp:Transcript_7260/g.27182  ORF Transcript_7260/g.27182 Transcript_7260/m.27182 type:complete len:208 (+) Transcript_7260:193-816(+)